MSLFPGADSAVTDASRFFYGSFNCDLEIPFNMLPIAHLRHYYTRRAKVTAERARPIAQYYAKQNETKTRVPSDNLHDVLLQRAIEQSAGGRNHAGLWLACQLRDNAYSQMDAERIVPSYAASVGGLGNHPYTEQEALKTLHGAYQKPAREPWTVAH